MLKEVEAADGAGFTVSDTGEVTDPAGEALEDAASLQRRIQEGLQYAGDLDRQYGKALADLCTDLAAMREGQADITVPGGRRMDPDDVIAYLNSLSQEERRSFLSKMSEQDIRRLTQANPEFMGNTDGVPFNVRAEANETLIRDAQADEERAGRGNGDRANKLREMLAEVSVPGRNGKPGNEAAPGADDRRSERRFIVFENTKNGRIIEMIGSLDKNSKSATVYVPGTTTNLDGSQSNYNAAWELANRTKGPVFFYMDGDLPQELGDKAATPLIPGASALGLGLLTANPALTVAGLGMIPGAVPDVVDGMKGTAADPSFARDMAPRLVSFGKELDAEVAANAPGAKTTYIGHSYGGSVVGSAEQLGLRADNVIYASSAGTGVFEGDWNNANPDVKRFSMMAPGDPIQYVQSLPGQTHGNDPDSAPGVTRIDTGYWDADRPDQGIVSGTDGHGKYWDRPESTAFQNMVNVINGDEPTEYVERQHDRVTDAHWSFFQSASWAAGPHVGILVDGADGDIDTPGPLPDIPLKWPWNW
ncbi:alpha/beta hydrolase [Gordonia araii]|uniref:alpha/beta hydrolase n=1 Tax=Gordonia araii TaxID=263909 RepID=UPI0002F297B6|nr:alpha/beta hydrolase [Gordonia araii]